MNDTNRLRGRGARIGVSCRLRKGDIDWLQKEAKRRRVSKTDLIEEGVRLLRREAGEPAGPDEAPESVKDAVSDSSVVKRRVVPIPKRSPKKR